LRRASFDSSVAFIAPVGYATEEEEILMVLHKLEQRRPSKEDAQIARTASQKLAPYAQQQRSVALYVRDAEEEPPIELPTTAVPLLLDILEAMAAGQRITITPEGTELTTVEAAKVLNVSRPFLIKLLATGKIPHRMVGKHRRVRVDDVLAYKARDDRERESVLDQLAHEAQEQDLGYRRS
jgi:excisionase family DNA binding protein